MKLLKITSYFFLVVILFTACRKEYSLEGGNLKVPTGTWEFRTALSNSREIWILPTLSFRSAPPPKYCILSEPRWMARNLSKCICLRIPLKRVLTKLHFFNPLLIILPRQKLFTRLTSWLGNLSLR